MLIQFKFRNFASFKNETNFLMTKVQSFKELLKSNTFEATKSLDLLRTAAIFGANGSGKSNFILAIFNMQKVIANSFSDSLKKNEDVTTERFSFRLSSGSEKASTMFEVSFLVEGSIYRYGFEVNGREIEKEWLYRKNEREVNLFIRNGQVFDINKESFLEGEKYKNDVNSNVLLLSQLAQNNQPISKIVFSWFNDVNAISGINDYSYNKFTAGLLDEDSAFKKWASLALKYLEISNIEAGKEDGEIVTYHNKYDENNLLIDSIPFNSMMESDGTNKLIHLLGPIYDTLKLGRILFVDELDSKLHPNLTKKLIALFHECNRNNAQLIFSAQDSTLLNKELFRRDQIWFVEKDQFGASSLYSLSDFDAKTVRNTSAYDKKYLANEFGAADTLQITNALIDLLHG